MSDADVPARLYLVNICIQVLTCKYAIHGDCSFEGGLYAELASFSNRLVLQTVKLKLCDICFCFCAFISGGCGCFVGKIPYCPPFLEIIPPPQKKCCSRFYFLTIGSLLRCSLIIHYRLLFDFWCVSGGQHQKHLKPLAFALILIPLPFDLIF